ncbi:hypothetical protein Glove_43g10 [Diversispora epigaea]|uniref:Uncharacterized protein n=1 Tax=Diversispora epigaea TaxID=1348612 RepID=A0A397JPN2_9GLOM|nr:hypothetical protein Glove_43g10 [Diversispora epigaea]
MDKKIDKRIYSTFQKFGSNSTREKIYSTWPRRKVNKITLLSTNFDNNGMRRSLSSLDMLHYENDVIRGNRPEKIFSKDANYIGRQNHDDGNLYVGSPKDSKFNIFNEKKKDNEIYVRGIDPLWVGINMINGSSNFQQQQISSKVESGNNASIGIVPFEYCTNREIIQRMQASLGQLFRIGTLESTSWTTKQKKKPCHLVLPDDHCKERFRENDDTSSMYQVSTTGGSDVLQECCNNSLMIVEMIASESDRLRVANSVGSTIFNEHPLENHVTDMLLIKEYGFNHIIIIGERPCGILFLDCYNRAFDFDSITLLLWPLGTYSEEVKNESQSNPWGVTIDKIVFEVEHYLSDEQNTFPITKRHKKKKNKSSKHHYV